jgi:hypothetical protein
MITLAGVKAFILEADYSEEALAEGIAYAESVGYDGNAEKFLVLVVSRLLYTDEMLAEGARYTLEAGSLTGVLICYLWVAEQSGPGLPGRRYMATNSSARPKRLVNEERPYSVWALLGTTEGTAFANNDGNFVDLEADGPTSVNDVVKHGLYTSVETGAPS